MAHLFACLIIEAVGEVDFMVQEGTLRSGCRKDSYSVRVQTVERLKLDTVRNRTRCGPDDLQEYLHLGCRPRGAVADRHHPADVARHGLPQCQLCACGIPIVGAMFMGCVDVALE